MIIIRINFSAILLATMCGAVANAQAVYDATSAFEAGWTLESNPIGVWSYGYSTSATAAPTLYDTPVTSGINGGNEQFWVSSALSYGLAPSIALNNGPAIDDGNINFLADELVICDGLSGQYSSIVFTAPANGIYQVDSSFRGDQHGVGTTVGLAKDGTDLGVSSSITSEGYIADYVFGISLNAGDTLDFYVGPDGGLQNTGFSATITLLPEPATLPLLLLGSVSLLNRRRR